eukprot:scpid103938/ scgid22730/ 
MHDTTDRKSFGLVWCSGHKLPTLHSASFHVTPPTTNHCLVSLPYKAELTSISIILLSDVKQYLIATTALLQMCLWMAILQWLNSLFTYNQCRITIIETNAL